MLPIHKRSSPSFLLSSETERIEDSKNRKAFLFLVIYDDNDELRSAHNKQWVGNKIDDERKTDDVEAYIVGPKQ